MARSWVRQVARNIYLLRVDDDKTKYFEALWEIPEGITYNSYFIDTGEKKILVDTWKHVYSTEFIESLRRITDPRDIDYIVVNHMEPDHSGSLPRVLEENRFKATVIGHPMTSSLISSFYNISPKFKPARDQEKLAVGKDSNLLFIHVPWLHWPETIMTYLDSEHILFSCDVFGTYGIPRTIYDEEIDQLKPFIRKYFATVIGYYRSWVIKNIEKVEDMGVKIDVIAPSHGVVWKNNPRFIIDYYKELALQKPSSKKIVVIYSSMYGFVEKAIDKVVETIRESGYNATVHRINDVVRSSIGDIISDVNDAAGIVVGVPTYEADVFPLMNYIIDLIIRKNSSSKKVLVVSSYGWGSVAGRKVAEKLSSKGFNVVDVIEFRTGIPSSVEKTIVEKTRRFIEKLS